MELKIEHKTTYSYSEPVFLEPHHLYLYPSGRYIRNLHSFGITLTPEPAGLALRLDAENNAYYQCWFIGTHDRLEISVEMEVQTDELNPLDFLIESKPILDHAEALKLYLHTDSPDKGMDSWIHEIEEAACGNLITFLSTVNREICNGWEHKVRYQTSLMEPEECFADLTGSCRDLSWMMIHIFRSRNIPARFISGYAFNPELEGHELHAWVEAWIPGGGWIGLDPSSGLFTTDHYVPLSASFHPYNTLPVQGSYRGDGKSRLETVVNIYEL